MEESLIKKHNPEIDFDRIEKYILGENNKYLLRYNESFKPSPDINLGIHQILYQGGCVSNSYCVSNSNRYCGTYLNRTITDLFRLCKYYYPELTLEGLYNLLLQKIIDKTLVSWICANIHKRTWWSKKDYPYNNDASGIASDLVDEFKVKFPANRSYNIGYGEHHTQRHLIEENY